MTFCDWLSDSQFPSYVVEHWKSSFKNVAATAKLISIMRVSPQFDRNVHL